MYREFSHAMNGKNAAISENIDNVSGEIIKEPHFFGVDDTKVTKLIDDVVNLEKHAETAALRTMDDVYRQTVNKAQLAMSTGMPLQKAIDMSVKDFLDKGINCIVYRDGRRVNIADYVRMALRTTSTRAKIQGESAKYAALGYDTVQVSKYSMCSDTCLPWQGKVYINDVFVMWDGEVEERENGELWGKSNYCGKWFPLLSTAIHAGLFHPNCRHTIEKYVDGDPLPKTLDNSEIEKRYKLEQKLRRLENNVRKAKRKAEGFSDPDNVKKANKELREAQKKVREFIDKVNEEYGKIILTRDYDREKIYSDFSQKNVDISDNIDYNMFRRTRNTGDFELLTEPMQKRHINSIIKDLGIDCKDIEFDIIRDKELIGKNVYGYTFPDGKKIQLYPDAFKSREELVKTIGHERIHSEQIKLFGASRSIEELLEYERAAAFSEDYWWAEYKERTGYNEDK